MTYHGLTGSSPPWTKERRLAASRIAARRRRKTEYGMFAHLFRSLSPCRISSLVFRKLSRVNHLGPRPAELDRKATWHGTDSSTFVPPAERLHEKNLPTALFFHAESLF